MIFNDFFKNIGIQKKKSLPVLIMYGNKFKIVFVKGRFVTINLFVFEVIPFETNFNVNLSNLFMKRLANIF